ncbi:MAG TPA: hypothetical protein VGS96_14390 [Thermoanaerobaculia bacterium]|jgi:hypothetical protein|nr:hypothetical protein [Thermoanaerobaculia bacterium]
MIRHFIQASVVFICANALAAGTSGFGLSVLVGDEPRPEYHARGTIYVEAIRGESYALRITNPMPYRVAVALSVDGLNTIDARHTDAWSAAKWVVGPYESTVISGWQVSDRTARRFFFTGENDSYGAALGKTENLGVIEAVFFPERHREITVYAPRSKAEAAPEAQRATPSDDYAATGMGERTGHEVERVDIDLERRPVASVRIRYEFRPQLIKLGVFTYDPMQRRERAKGFERFCPEPK